VRVIHQLALYLHHEAGLLDKEDFDRVLHMAGYWDRESWDHDDHYDDEDDDWEQRARDYADQLEDEADQQMLDIERRLERRDQARRSPEAEHRKPRLKSRRAAARRRPKTTLSMEQFLARLRTQAPGWSAPLRPLVVLGARLSPAGRRWSEGMPPSFQGTFLVAAAGPTPLLAAIDHLLAAGKMTGADLLRLLAFEQHHRLVNPSREKGPVVSAWRAACAAEGSAVLRPPLRADEPLVRWAGHIPVARHALLSACSTAWL